MTAVVDSEQKYIKDANVEVEVLVLKLDSPVGMGTLTLNIKRKLMYGQHKYSLLGFTESGKKVRYGEMTKAELAEKLNEFNVPPSEGIAEFIGCSVAH